MSELDPLQRRLRIDSLLRSRPYISKRLLVERLGVCAKTVERDFDYMRLRWDAPIEYSLEKNGYYYTEESFSLPAVMMSEKEFLALLLTEKAAEIYRETPLYEPLKSGIEKLETILGDQVRFSADWLMDRFTIISGSPTPLDTEVWDGIFCAVRDQRECLIRYRRPAEGQSRERPLHPYHIIAYQGGWYVLGKETEIGEIRLFAVNRIEDVKLTSRIFEEQWDFDIADYIDPALGITARREEEAEVVLKVIPEAAPVAAERIWHPTQKITTEADGSLLIRFRTGQTEDVLYRVLSWGSKIEILEPADLRNTITDVITEMKIIYGNDLPVDKN